jgi:NADPH-dependent glutamate synthase beta subunit-like oxidoreductase/NAD-dependent dihydropyrimidine dehydrogenase PreA subunit
MPHGLQFYDENIPCLAACPVHTNAGAYVAAIADGDDLTAYLTARLPNPFASACGRVCAAPCEDACRRGEIDEPIAIRALKRFVTEKYGVEAQAGQAWLQVAAPTGPDRNQSIGIVGGGPAGMACAHDLRRHGYQVTVYEATGQLGGMMKLGIPEYRLDRDLLDAELQAIVDLGVEVHLNTKLGEDVTFEELRARHDALFLAIGATLGRGLDIEGHQSDGVLKAIEFLINANQGFEVEVGDRVIVIGGGDVAMDAARTALRRADYQVAASTEDIEAEERNVMTEALDAARTATRVGATEVTVISLESEEEMPASPFELQEAAEENIAFIHRRGPARILAEDGKVVGLETIGVTSVFDDEGRFAPQFDTEDRRAFEADTVILAIGQAIDVDAIGPSGPAISPRKTIMVGDDTLATSLDLVWAGGDAARGPRTLIEAIADGRKAAAEIHERFSGESPSDVKGELVELQQFHRLTDTYDRDNRYEVPTLATDRRIGLAEVELGFTEQQARCEAARCLRCFANITLDINKCVLCALCADVCPLDLISLVPSEEVGGPIGTTTLLLDERACIRCGLCIERCPPEALSMSVWTGVGVPKIGELV